MLKRPAAAEAPAPAAKKGKKAKVKGARKVTFKGEVRKKCTVVSGALEDSEHLPEKVASLLSVLVRDSLGVVKSEREDCQEECVKLIEEGLQRVEKGLEEAASQAKSKVEGFHKDVDEKLKARQEAEEKLKTLQANLDQAQSELTANAQAVKASKKELQLAQQASEAGPSNAELVELVGGVGRAIEEFKGRAASEADDSEKLTKLVEDCKKLKTDSLKIDHTVLVMLPVSFKKGPGDRSGMDKMVIEQLDSEFSKFKDLTDRQQTDAKGESEAAKESIEIAQKKIEECAAKQEALAKAVTDSTASLKEGLKVFKGLAENTTDIKKVQKAAEKAEAQLSSFRSGALAKFNELLHLTRPAEADGADDVASADEGGGTEAEAEGNVSAKDDQDDAQEDAQEDAGENAGEEGGDDVN